MGEQMKQFRFDVERIRHWLTAWTSSPVFEDYLIRTVAKEGSVCINVSLATLSIVPGVVKSSSLGCRLATISIFVADLHHSATMTSSVFDSACLDGNAWHLHTYWHWLEEVKGNGENVKAFWKFPWAPIICSSSNNCWAAQNIQITYNSFCDLAFQKFIIYQKGVTPPLPPESFRDLGLLNPSLTGNRP